MTKKEQNSKPVASDKVTALYVRLTREESLKTGLSAPAQRSDAQDYAKHAGLPIPEFYEEEIAVGGDVPFNKRIAGKNLVRDIRNGKIGHLVARDLDRLVRDEKLWPDLRDLCLHHGVTLHTFWGPVPLDSPSDRFATGVRVLAAQLEKEQTGDRGRRAKRQLAKHGRHVGGPPPFGYTSQSRRRRELIETGIEEQMAQAMAEKKYPRKGQLYIDDTESKIVKLIFDLYIEKRRGCRQIKIELNRRGYRRRSGLRWVAEKVRKIINNPTLAGFIAYDEARYRNQRIPATPKHKQKRYPGKHAPIVSEEVWLKAQEIKTGNTSKANGRGNASAANRRYPLSGILRCFCGSPMKAASVSGQGKYGQYCCYRRRDHGPDDIDGCGAPRLSIKKADTAFWSTIRRLMDSSDLIDRVHAAAMQIAAEREKERDEQPNFTDQLAKVVADIDRWYERHDSTSFAVEKEAAWQRVVQLQARKKEIENQLRAHSPRPTKNALPVTRDQVESYINGLAASVGRSKEGCGLVKLFVEHHGLRVRLVDAESISVSLKFRPPGAGSDELVEVCAPVETICRFDKGKIDAWLERHAGKHKCKICGSKITVLRRHYWNGIPKHHRNCWTSQLTKRRSNPDPSRFFNGREASAILGISQSTLGRWVKAGKVTPVEKRSGVSLFDKKRIENHAESNGE